MTFICKTIVSIDYPFAEYDDCDGYDEHPHYQYVGKKRDTHTYIDVVNAVDIDDAKKKMTELYSCKNIRKDREQTVMVTMLDHYQLSNDFKTTKLTSELVPL